MAIFTDLSSYGVYSEEAAYADDSGLAVTTFPGIINRIDPSFNNSNVYIRGIGGGRSPLQVKAGILEGTLGVEFKVQNADFMKYTLGARTGAGTVASPYAYAVADSPPTLTYEVAQELGATDQAQRLLGCLCQNAQIRCEEKNPIVATTNFIARTLGKSNAYQAVSPSTDPVYHFLNGTLESPQGSTIAEVPSVEWNILNHAENYYEIGSRLGRGVFKEREFLGNMKARIIDGYWMDKFLDGGTGSTAPSAGTPAAIATMRLNFTNGSEYIYMNYSNVYVDSWRGNYEQGNLAEQDIQIRALGCTATEVVP